MEENNKVEKICEEIRKQTQQQQDTILQKARDEAEKTIFDAQNQAKKYEEEEKKKNDEEIQRLKERIYSTQTIEKKRITLINQGLFVQKIFDKVMEYSNIFRSSKEYKDFLKKSIKEGIEVIGTDKAEVLYSINDEKYFDKQFIEDVKIFCNPGSNKNFSLDFQKGDFQDIGIIVNSSDKRIIYDNRFSTKFERLKGNLQREIIKEVFKNA
jgi:vacuolar-type H+-ATPase subunit E/Vma4